jgi:hypothetical protein
MILYTQSLRITLSLILSGNTPSNTQFGWCISLSYLNMNQIPGLNLILLSKLVGNLFNYLSITKESPK